jgi:hypothetical protein
MEEVKIKDQYEQIDFVMCKTEVITILQKKMT